MQAKSSNLNLGDQEQLASRLHHLLVETDSARETGHVSKETRLAEKEIRTIVRTALCLPVAEVLAERLGDVADALLVRDALRDLGLRNEASILAVVELWQFLSAEDEEDDLSDCSTEFAAFEVAQRVA